jgi:hypothetical protein
VRIHRKGEKGGKTVVQVKTLEGVELEGVAFCSKKENYNKKIGTKIALIRAFGGNNFTKQMDIAELVMAKDRESLKKLEENNG